MRRERPLLAEVVAHEVEGVLDRRQHAETQQVELDQPHPCAVVLVPLHHGALVHARVLDRHDLAHRAVGEHHAARVDAEVPRERHRLEGELDDLGRDVVVVTRDQRTPALHLLRPRILLAGTRAERLRHVAHRELRPVAHDVGDLRGVLAAVLVEHVLDDELAPVGLEVDVDVGLLVAHRRQEPLERQLVEDRVDRRDAQQVADRGVRGRAAALAQDAEPLRVLHDVVDDQEVAGEVLHLDHVELAIDALEVLLGGLDALALHARPHEFTQPRHRGVPFWHLLLR